MRDHFRNIYQHRAADYDALVAREDYQGNLARALAEVRPWPRLDVVEPGAGTGRLTRLLAPAARSVVALDIAPAMLRVARASLDADSRVTFAVADNGALPLRDAVADLAVAGWSLGHSVAWFPNTWRGVIGTALAEMRRVLRPGGTVVILETLGTGRETPAPPTDELAAYYRWLEDQHGFHRTWLRTDYRFASLDEAEQLTRFFFGDDLADRVRREGLETLPECTGMWWF